MLAGLRQRAGRNLINSRGWRTNRKIVVIESDDWGAIRMSSRENLNELARSGIAVHKCHYVQNDALASEYDLDRLFDLLGSYKGLMGRSPIITANVIMANPDFGKIRESGFREYYNEIFTKTLGEYPNHTNSFNIWKTAFNEELFHPQFHGREHLQVLRWMKFLQDPDSDTRRAFDLNICSLSTTVTSENRRSYLASYDWDDSESERFVKDAVREGLNLFNSVFGFQSQSSIAPNYIWHNGLERILNESGVRYIQGSPVQNSPLMGGRGTKKIRHFTGQLNDFGQRYLVRNCVFEPSSKPAINWVDRAMNDINNAFLWKKPAIIASHRVNFIGYINPENRDRNLRLFKKLLNKIFRTWPEVEFMTSDELGQIIENNE